GRPSGRLEQGAGERRGLRQATGQGWCTHPESNRDALRRGILSPLRLPISPWVRGYGWRKRWDSNPRRAQTLAGFLDRCLQPLGQASVLCRRYGTATGRSNRGHVQWRVWNFRKGQHNNPFEPGGETCEL